MHCQGQKRKHPTSLRWSRTTSPMFCAHERVRTWLKCYNLYNQHWNSGSWKFFLTNLVNLLYNANPVVVAHRVMFESCSDLVSYALCIPRHGKLFSSLLPDKADADFLPKLIIFALIIWWCLARLLHRLKLFHNSHSIMQLDDARYRNYASVKVIFLMSGASSLWRPLRERPSIADVATPLWDVVSACWNRPQHR